MPEGAMNWEDFFKSRNMMEGSHVTCSEDSVLEIHFRDGTFHTIFPSSNESKPTLEHGIVMIVHPGKETLYYGTSEITFVRQRINPRYHASKSRDYAMEEGDTPTRVAREVTFKEVEGVPQKEPLTLAQLEEQQYREKQREAMLREQKIREALRTDD